MIGRWRLRRAARRRLRDVLGHDLEPAFVRERSRPERSPARRGDDQRPWRLRWRHVRSCLRSRRRALPRHRRWRRYRRTRRDAAAAVRRRRADRAPDPNGVRRRCAPAPFAS